MELATAATSSLLCKLGSLLIGEYTLQKGVRGEIRFLQAEMEMMQAALEKVSKLTPNRIDDDVKIWARDLKELCYDIEDSVDNFLLHIDAPVYAKPKGFRRFFDRTLALLTKANSRHHIASDIKEIKRRIDEVAARRERYKFQDTAVQPDAEPIDARVLASFVDAAKLVGVDGPTEKIVNLLTQGKGGQKQNLKVVSIVGVGGLGKTTIANSVYEKLQGQFSCKAFVTVSLKPNLKQIFSSILRQVTKDDESSKVGEKEPEELIRNIREFLMDKRYLIVIDDLWDKEAWQTINYALVDNNLDSKVILTTRNMDVANFSTVDGTMYELDPLSDEDSRILFCKRVFNEEDLVHPELRKVTNKILKKCGGIPLAIITIASMLASRTAYEWYDVYNLIGSGLQKDRSLENMREILYLSYSDLPSYLKPCLLYLSMFPEDSVILKDDLVRLWAAEGFFDENMRRDSYYYGNMYFNELVNKNMRRDSYYYGNMYFNELVNRSMIQPVSMDEYGYPIGCRVHDMVRDLIILLSAQENFAIISEGPKLISPMLQIRRLSLQESKFYMFVQRSKFYMEEHHSTGEKLMVPDSTGEKLMVPATVNMCHVRSLIVTGDAFKRMPSLSKFSVLRVLSMKEFPSNSHPKDLGSLHHLRYLELGGKLETELLEEIAKLRLLKTLDLWGATTSELPSSIFQLQQLEHLIINHRCMKLLHGIGNLTSLQTLSGLRAKETPNDLAEMGNLTELRELSLYRLEHEETEKIFLQSLSNLGNLRTLKLIGKKRVCSLNCIPDGWKGPTHLQNFRVCNIFLLEVPRWFSSLSELSVLIIRVTNIGQDDLHLFGALPVLRFLKLVVSYKSATKERLVIGSDHPFRSLAEFRFIDYGKRYLVFEQGAMPKLRRIQLCFSSWNRNGRWFDVGLENLSSLEHITVGLKYNADRTREDEDTETMIREAIDIHPNHPTLELPRRSFYD